MSNTDLDNNVENNDEEATNPEQAGTVSVGKPLAPASESNDEVTTEDSTNENDSE